MGLINLYKESLQSPYNGFYPFIVFTEILKGYRDLRFFQFTERKFH